MHTQQWVSRAVNNRYSPREAHTSHSNPDNEGSPLRYNRFKLLPDKRPLCNMGAAPRLHRKSHQGDDEESQSSSFCFKEKSPKTPKTRQNLDWQQERLNLMPYTGVLRYPWDTPTHIKAGRKGRCKLGQRTQTTVPIMGHESQWDGPSDVFENNRTSRYRLTGQAVMAVVNPAHLYTTWRRRCVSRRRNWGTCQRGPRPSNWEVQQMPGRVRSLSGGESKDKLRYCTSYYLENILTNQTNKACFPVASVFPAHVLATTDITPDWNAQQHLLP